MKQQHEQRQRDEHSSSYAHHYTNEKEQSEKISRRFFLALCGGAAGLIGLTAVVKFSHFFESLLYDSIHAVKKESLHSPETHYCHLKVFKDKLVFEKKCCQKLVIAGARIDGNTVRVKIVSTNPLKVELPAGVGKDIEIFVREGESLKRYAFSV